MNTTQLEFQERKAGGSQCDRILDLLQKRAGQWVAMPEMAEHGSGTPGGFCMVHSRVADLRRNGHTIEHSQEWRDGKCNSFYRLVNPPETHG